MKILQIIPGSGNTFYCENCLRDDGLVRTLGAMGHDAAGLPLYLPLMSDEPEALDDAPVFFGGINVYLQQKFGLFRRTPRWIDRLFDSPRLLRWAARRSGMTRATDLGETMLSMLRGEHGRQVKELERLVDYLVAHDPPDVVCLSNALLLGLAERIQQALRVPVVCMLQDEDAFVDALPEALREQVWSVLGERAGQADAFVAVSRYYADVMRRRLALPADRVHVVHTGIAVDRWPARAGPPEAPTIGYLSRLCPAKGLDLLVEAFEALRAGGAPEGLKLRVAGGWTDGDLPFIDGVRRRLSEAHLADDVELLGNLDADDRRAFLGGLSVLSVPTRAGEAFGLYVVEALACGVPVVLPRHGSFVELVETTGGGLLVEPNDPAALADAIGQLLADPARAAALGAAGRRAVAEKFSAEGMARAFLRVCQLP